MRLQRLDWTDPIMHRVPIRWTPRECEWKRGENLLHRERFEHRTTRRNFLTHKARHLVGLQAVSYLDPIGTPELCLQGRSPRRGNGPARWPLSPRLFSRKRQWALETADQRVRSTAAGAAHPCPWRGFFAIRAPPACVQAGPACLLAGHTATEAEVGGPPRRPLTSKGLLMEDKKRPGLPPVLIGEESWNRTLSITGRGFETGFRSSKASWDRTDVSTLGCKSGWFLEAEKRSTTTAKTEMNTDTLPDAKHRAVS